MDRYQAHAPERWRREAEASLERSQERRAQGRPRPSWSQRIFTAFGLLLAGLMLGFATYVIFVA